MVVEVGVAGAALVALVVDCRCRVSRRCGFRGRCRRQRLTCGRARPP